MIWCRKPLHQLGIKRKRCSQI